MPIICLETEEVIGRVEDLLFDSRGQMVRGLLGNTMIGPGRHIYSLNRLRHQQVLTSRNAAHELDRDFAVNSPARFSIACRGLTILDPDAHKLGYVVDIFFRDDGGRIEGFEVSRGLLANLCSGTAFIPSTETAGICDGTLRVTHDGADILEAQVGRVEHAIHEIIPG